MHNMTRERLIREQAKSWLEGFGIPWAEYDAGVIQNRIDPIDGWTKNDPERVIFTHRKTGHQVVFSGMYVNEETGKVMQAGHNYGRLVY